MKIGLIAGGNIWFLPYIKNYTSILDSLNIDYDLISWNRDGADKKIGIQYHKVSPISKNKIGKLLDLVKFIKFVKNQLKINKYDKLIIFGPKLGIFLKSYLEKEYKNRYILDYRDLSIEQNPFLKSFFKSVVNSSTFTCVSSPGFLSVLPKSNKYIITHNFLIETAEYSFNQSLSKYTTNPIVVRTIGGIRDYNSNSAIIESLSNHNDILISFVGKGIAEEKLKTFASSIKTTNIEFLGYYDKSEEAKYVEKSTFLNIFYPPIISHSTALSNRFYNSLIFKRPMIVTSNSTQGDYVEKYNVGITITDTRNLDTKIHDWLKNNDFNEYCKRADTLMRELINEQKIFINKVQDFLQS